MYITAAGATFLGQSYTVTHVLGGGVAYSKCPVRINIRINIEIEPIQVQRLLGDDERARKNDMGITGLIDLNDLTQFT